MFKILSTYSCSKKIYKMQHLESSGTPVLYIGRMVLKVKHPVAIAYKMKELTISHKNFFLFSASFRKL
jgi:hypothetical protein